MPIVMSHLADDRGLSCELFGVRPEE